MLCISSFELYSRRVPLNTDLGFDNSWYRAQPTTSTSSNNCLIWFWRFLRSVSCQQDDQIWRICLRTVDFYRIDAWKSIFTRQKWNIREVYSIGLWLFNFTVRFLCLIVRPWDCSRNCKSHGKTVSLERSVIKKTISSKYEWMLDCKSKHKFKTTMFRGTQRGYSSKPLNIALLNVF